MIAVYYQQKSEVAKRNIQASGIQELSSMSLADYLAPWSMTDENLGLFLLSFLPHFYSHVGLRLPSALWFSLLAVP